MKYNRKGLLTIEEDAVIIQPDRGDTGVYDQGTTISHGALASCIGEVLGEVLTVDDIPLQVCS